MIQRGWVVLLSFRPLPGPFRASAWALGVSEIQASATAAAVVPQMTLPSRSRSTAANSPWEGISPRPADHGDETRINYTGAPS